MYSPMPRRSGRDSIRVRLTPANANTARQETSQPEAPEPMPQNTSDVLAGPLSGGSGAASARGASQAKRVALPGIVLEVLGEHHRAVAAGGEPRADRRARARAVLRDLADRVGGRGGGHDGRARHVLGEPVLALPERLRVRAHHRDLRQRQLAARREAVGDRLDDLADQRDVGRLERERVEHGVHAALERVLDRRQRPLDPPLLDGEHDVAQRRQRHGLELGRRRGQRLVADRARRAEVRRLSPGHC